MNRIFKLTLSSPVYYIKTDKSFSSLFEDLFKKERGYDFALLYEFYINDEVLHLSLIDKGIHEHAHTLEEEKDPDPGNTFSIQKGDYIFTQTIPLERESDIKRSLLPLIGNLKKGKAYIRFFKENQFETVMQFFIT